MEYHQRCPGGNSRILSQMTDQFRAPKDFPSLVYVSMLLQAEGIRYGVEHWRRNMHRVSGTLYWQLNDCWPVASWSSIDHFGRWKALHYAARRFYAPVLLSIEDDPPGMSVHVTNDLAEPWEGVVKWSLQTLDGEILETGREAVFAPPLASTCVSPSDFQLSEQDRCETVFAAELWHEEKRISYAVGTFVPNKQLLLRDPALKVDVRLDGQVLVLDCRSQSLARYLELALDGTDIVFSDNYFDVPAGTTVTVTCPQPNGWTVTQSRKALRVRSLFESY
jgi:beta-mannosidase